MTALNPSFSQSDEKGPYIDQATFIWREDENLALEEVRSGDFDAYFFRIPLEAADDAKNDARLKVYDRTAGSQGLHKPRSRKGRQHYQPVSVQGGKVRVQLSG